MLLRAVLRSLINYSRRRVIEAMSAPPTTRRSPYTPPWPYGETPISDEQHELESWLFDRASRWHK